jgi:hypothetical protein
MDKTFIKTREGIIRLEHISHIYEFFTEGEILISLTNGNNITLSGEEAQLFLQFIPIAIDLSKLKKKEESGIEIAGLKM